MFPKLSVLFSLKKALSSLFKNIKKNLLYFIEFLGYGKHFCCFEIIPIPPTYSIKYIRGNLLPTDEESTYLLSPPTVLKN